MSLTLQEKRIAYEYAQNGATFMFILSAGLCDLITKDHIMTKKMNNSLKILLLQKKPIRLDPQLIIKYCKGTIDKKNEWLLDHGDIKAEPKMIDIDITKMGRHNEKRRKK